MCNLFLLLLALLLQQFHKAQGLHFQHSLPLFHQAQSLFCMVLALNLLYHTSFHNLLHLLFLPPQCNQSLWQLEHKALCPLLLILTLHLSLL
ncbi:hypothetical protein LguiB_016863 [Lonicera macranthoides]